MTLILVSLSFLQVKVFWKSENSLFDNVTSQLNCGSATRSVDVTELRSGRVGGGS